MNAAEFRALRERVGASQQTVASACGVRVLAVKRWENPDHPSEPPDDAAEWLLGLLEVQKQQVAFALSKCEETEAMTGNKPNAIQLTYWRSEADMEASHPGEGWGWQVANATARAVASELEAHGYSVEFGWGGLRAAGLEPSE